MPYRITRSQWINKFNSLVPGDTIWWHRTWSTLVQVMACCLMILSHYLNQCWQIISKVQWQSLEDNILHDIPHPSITKIELNITYLKVHSNVPAVNELNSYLIEYINREDVHTHVTVHPACTVHNQVLTCAELFHLLWSKMSNKCHT